MTPAQRQLQLARRRLRLMHMTQEASPQVREQERHVASAWVDVKLEESAKRREEALALSEK